MDNRLIVGELDHQKRVDVYLSEQVEALSRNGAQLLCAAGQVEKNGILCNKKDKVSVGDLLIYRLSDPVKLDAFPQNIPLEIVYEDPHLLVVNKPQGMVVHPAAGNPDGTLVNAVLFYCEGQLSSINGVIRPGIVHRIDKDTSGLLVIAKDDVTHEGLAAQFAVHSIQRIYLAVVHGNLKADSGTIDRPLGRHPTDRKKMCITDKNSRHAVTHYTVLERYQGFTLVQLQLETGRTHQIRVHLASLGHPVAGDAVYGPAKGVKGLQGQCLHAKTLGFVHPITEQWMQFDSELPPYFQKFLAKCKGEASLG